MKKFLLFLFLIAILSIEAEETSFYFSFSENIYNYGNYINESGMPLLPIIIKEAILPYNTHIDSIKVVSFDKKTIQTQIQIGQGSYPLSFPPPERITSLKDIKGEYPNSIIRNYSHNRENGNNHIYFSLTPYHYINNNIYLYDNLKITVFYTIDTNIRLDNTKTERNRYLVLTSDSLVSYFNSFKEFYKNRGYDVIVRSIDSIQDLYPTDTLIYAVRKYLQSSYADSSLYALLIACDTDVLPGIYIHIPVTPQIAGNDTIVTDRFYQCLDGNWDNNGNGIIGEVEDSIDMYPDILYGRMSFHNGSEITGFTDKIKRFYSFATDTVLMVGNQLDDNTDGGVGQDNVFMAAEIQGTPYKLYESDDNLTPTTFINALNNSPYLGMHDGHGWQGGIQSGTGYLTNSMIDTLHSNGFLLYSVSCISAAFDMDCFAEHISLNSYGGFYIGHSRYGWYCPYFAGFGPGEITEKSFFRNLMTNPLVGESFNNTLTDIIPYISGNNDYRWTYMVLTYMGDPLLRVVMPMQKTYTINLQKTDSLYISGTIIPADSGITISNTHGTTNITYYNNHFYLPYDSILIINKMNISDTIFITKTTSTAVYTESYYYRDVNHNNWENGDTAILYLSLESSGQIANIEPLSNSLVTPITNSFSITISSDTLISIKYLLSNSTDSFLLPVVINEDTLYFNISKTIDKRIKTYIKPVLSAYNTDSSVSIDINSTIYGTSPYGYNIIFSSENYAETLFTTDTIINKTLILSPTEDSLILNIYIQSDSFTTYTKKSILFAETSDRNNPCSYITDFYTDTLWHIDTTFYYSDNAALYCGIDSLYPADIIAKIQTKSFIYDSTIIGGFMTYYNVEAGWDFCVTRVIHGNDTFPIATYDGNSETWHYQPLDFSTLPIRHGDTISLQMALFSDDDAYQYQGWYIDNLVLPALNGEYLSFVNTPKININKENDIIVYNILGNDIYILSDKPVSWEIYDLSGRRILKGNKKIISLELMPSKGVYFALLKQGNNIKWIKIIK